jgi:hypothetical protein
MFYRHQSEIQKKEYKQFLKIAGCLSNLFSDSDIPYLYYRIAEKVFCRAFNADDLSRSDVSADAKKDTLGIGLKTFLIGNNKSFQKVAEFNSDRSFYVDLKPERLIKKVSELRNARIDFTEEAHALDSSIYHCVLRDSNKFKIFEEKMDRVDIDCIRNIRVNKNSIAFNDGINDYSFLLSKSTLTKRFSTDRIIHEFDVDILSDPLIQLGELFKNGGLLFGQDKKIKQTVYLPLYGRNQTVFERSGLNQWNAGGRERHSDEVYIPVPSEVHRNYPDFFPAKDVSFNLRFPDGDVIEAKMCQAGRKALMTNPNKKLGKLILRDGLKLAEGELVTYEMLQLFGIDSVRIDKINNEEYEINFSEVGSYENFKNTFAMD